MPVFVYHPDPVQTGSIAPASESCTRCGRADGWMYTGPVYTELDEHHGICLWCISDGTAATQLRATFTDGSAAPTCQQR